MEHLLYPGAWLDRFTRWVAFIGLIGLLIVSIVTMVDVLLRWLFSAPIEGYEDITRLLFAIIVASCFPAGLLQGRNITIRFLGKALGSAATRYLEALGAIATLFFFTVVTWRVAVFALDETVNNRFTQTLEISTGPWWWFVSALLLMCVPVQFVIAWAKTSAAIRNEPLQYTDNEMSI
ncbi:MAG: TRAP-type C4-dicarboxylate transport system permease small subunit [Paracoccaceae bacterium]